MCYFFLLDDFIIFSPRYLIFSFLFTIINNVLYAYRIIILKNSAKVDYMDVFRYSVDISVINLIFPFRSGDAIYFIKNKKAPINLRENYILFVKTKLVELIIIAIIINLFFSNYPSYLLCLFALLFLVFMIPLRFIFASALYVFVVLKYLHMFFLDFSIFSFELFLLTINFLFPAATFGIFGIGDVFIDYFGVATLEKSTIMRTHTLLSVLFVFVFVRFNVTTLRKFFNWSCWR